MAFPFDQLRFLGPEAANRLMQPTPMGPQNMLEAAGNGQLPPLPPPVDVRTVPVAGVDPMTVSATPADPWAGMRQVTPQQNLSTAQVPAKKGFFDRLHDFADSDRGQLMQDVFTGWAMGSTPQQSLAYGGAMAAQGRKDRKGVNETVEWLKGKGYDEATAKRVAGSPTLLQDVLKQMLAPQDPKKNLMSVDGKIYDAGSGSWITPPTDPNAGPSDLGLNPQYGVDQQGNPVLLQLGKDGRVVQSQMPEGVSLSKAPIRLDAGTHFVLLDPITRQPIGQVEKNIADVEDEKVQGKARGDAKVALPGAASMADEISKQVQSLSDDPYLESMLGPWDSRMPNISTDAARVQGKMDQLQGGAFLQARQMLKGGGAITDYEGQKAEAAFARLNAAQSPADYKEALADFNYWVQQGVAKLEQQARGGGGVSKSGRSPSSNGSTNSGLGWSVEP